MVFREPKRSFIAVSILCAAIFVIDRQFRYHLEKLTIKDHKVDKYYSNKRQKVAQEFQFPKDFESWMDKQVNVTMKDPPLIIYTRIEKCGGRSMIGVMQRLSVRNGFLIDGIGAESPKAGDLESRVQSISNFRKPRIHHAHMHFIDFQSYGYKNPTFINIVRDPADRMASLYYFNYYGDATASHLKNPVLNINECILDGHRNCSWHRSFMLGSYFCGTDRICHSGSEVSLKIAKKHIDENYLFVGMAEDFEVTIQILERLLPDYFEGAMDIWKEIGKAFSNATATKHRGKLNPEAREALERMLVYDYEVYNYVKAKFVEVKERLGVE